MTPAFEELPDAIPSCPDNLGAGGLAPQFSPSPDSFLWRQFRAAGLEAVAEKVAAGRDLNLEEALALSRASLPLLAVLITLRRDVFNPPPAAGDAAARALPIERVSSRPESPRHVGQPLADWDSLCQTLFALRRQIAPGGGNIAWYPVVAEPLDRDRRVGFSPPVRDGGLKPTLPSQEIASGCDGHFTGVEVLRAIALARLLLPAEIEVRAPLAMLGPKLAQVALEFGASHLGCVALDGQTPDDPLVADPSVLDELLEST